MDDYPQAQDPADYEAVCETQLQDELFEGMSETAVADFLREHGIPDKYCEVFEDNYIDGKELLSLTESEVKNLIQPLGIVKKILRLIPQIKTTTSFNGPSSSIDLTQQSLSSNEEQQFSTPASSRSVSLCSDTSGSSTTCGALMIPDHWRPEVESCIKNKMLTPSARNDIVRTLVSQLFSRSNKPTRLECEVHARKLVSKYPFLKDDRSEGFQSWADKMVERVRNVLKRDSKKGKHPLDTSATTPPVSKRKKDSDILRRYPINTISDEVEDYETIGQHKKALATELSKAKPRDSVLLPLMRSTFQDRRMFILSEEVSVCGILQEYSALSKPAIIEQEMGLINDQPDVRAQFLKQWSKFIPAIIAYGDSSSKRRVCSHVYDLDECDEVAMQVAALKVLAEVLGRKLESLDYFYEEFSSMEDIEEICHKASKITQPRIVALKGEENTQYFISCECHVLCKVSSLKLAIFTAFSSYYIFNLKYPPSVKNLLCFLQDYMLEHPDSTKKSATYLAVVSDIKRCL